MDNLKGSRLRGGNGRRERVEHDFYATPPEATEALMRVEEFHGEVWEPACGQGHMAKVIKKYNPVIASDLIDRGYGSIKDFLKSDTMIHNIITNPPFNLFSEFVEHALRCAEFKVAFFAKLQALTGIERTKYLETTPMKHVYIFRRRISCWANGSATDENGRPWSGTELYCWIVWKQRYCGRPDIRWI